VRAIERSRTFNPARFDPRQPWPMPEATRELWPVTDDDVRLHAWLLEGTGPKRRGALLYFHGNGGYLPTYLPALEKLRGHGFDVMAVDYRGYGKSGGAPQDEAALYRDGDAAVRSLAESLGCRPQEMVLYGHSLGTTVAAEMAIRHGCRALVLQAPLASLQQQMRHSMPWVPPFFGGLTANRFETAAKIRNLASPLLVMHGEQDRVIPVEQGIAVYEAAREPKRLKLYPDGEHILGDSTGWSHLAEAASFVDEMVPRST